MMDVHGEEGGGGWRGATMAAPIQPAIPLLIKAWDEKALPHLREKEIAAAIVGRVSIIHRSGSEVFDQWTSKHL